VVRTVRVEAALYGARRHRQSLAACGCLDSLEVDAVDGTRAD
jgi:hypothetical protein